MIQVYQNNTHRLFVSTEELMKVFLASENDIKRLMMLILYRYYLVL